MTDRDMRICGNKGFQLDLPNGVTVSVQFGPGNYCDSDVSNAAFDAPKKAIDGDDHWGSNTAECAAYITGSNLSWVAVPGWTGPIDENVENIYDDVAGHMTVQDVLDFINAASRVGAEPNPNSLGNKMMDHLSKQDPFSDEFTSNYRNN
tara:strand:- start:2823 stop:3269 length:447 start_codon:yes stop_codon:yes gene_type:complete